MTQQTTVCASAGGRGNGPRASSCRCAQLCGQASVVVARPSMTARFEVPAAHPHLAPLCERRDRRLPCRIVGGFMCRCESLWTLKAETTYGSHLLPNEVVFEEHGKAPPQLLEHAAQQSQVILEPALTIVAYDDTGWSAKAHVETWVDENDNLDPHRFVARVGER